MIQIGDTIGDYQVIGVLGRGGMGRVYRVRSLITDREEAMKVVLPDIEETPDLADRFLQEIKVHASLDHPNIAALRAATRVGGRVVMILELVEGATLEELSREGPVDAPRAVSVARQVLSALEFAHARGVIHRDIKPANILVTAAGQVKLTDFGIARVASQHRVTMTGLAVGSLPYMSPEQIGGGDVDARSDIYSLGITLYQIVTGRRPIDGVSEFAIMSAQMTQLPAPPSHVVPGLDAGLSDAIMKALAKEPRQRFQSAAEFRTALNAVGNAAAWVGAAEATLVLPVRTAIPAEDLKRIESGLSRILGPIAPRLTATAARTAANLEDLCQRLAAEIADPQERQTFLKTCLGGAAKSGPRTALQSGGAQTASAQSGSAPQATGLAQTAAPRQWDQTLLDRLAQALAAYIGPIAKVVVNRAAKKARSQDELFAAAAAEIDSEAARQRFLNSVSGSRLV